MGLDESLFVFLEYRKPLQEIDIFFENEMNIYLVSLLQFFHQG